jgi:hypothetical protein
VPSFATGATKLAQPGRTAMTWRNLGADEREYQFY